MNSVSLSVCLHTFLPFSAFQHTPSTVISLLEIPLHDSVIINSLHLQSGLKHDKYTKKYHKELEATGTGEELRRRSNRPERNATEVTMGFTALHIHCLLTAFTLTTQELAKLSVSPKITAECGQQVTLNCDVSSSRNGLSVIHMGWSHNKTTLCSVDSEGTITTHHRHTTDTSDFRCEYEHGQLSLIFKKVQPLESGKRYTCKLHSNQGAPYGHTRVELKECCGSSKGILTSDGPVCTFNHVHPDGDVHWFHGSHNLSDGSYTTTTTKSVDEKGWLTINSSLKRKSSDVRYSCSLKSTTSGRYIASTLIQNHEFQVRGAGKQGATDPEWNGVGSQRPMKTILCISILLAVTLK